MKLAVLATSLLSAVSAHAGVCQNSTELKATVDQVFANFEAKYDAQSAQNEVQKRCPELPWADILMVAEDIRSTDQAIQLGTSNKSYLFEVSKNAFAESIDASGPCLQSPQTINLWMCIEKAVCTKVGKQSTICAP